MSKFKDLIKQAEDRASQKVINQKETEFPELTDEQQEKLEDMFARFLELQGRRTSSMTLDELRLTDFFTKRFLTDGCIVRKVGLYATLFVIRGLGVNFAIPSGNFIFEDEPIIPHKLYGNPFQLTGNIYHDTLDSYPDNYISPREYRSKAEIWAVFKGRHKDDLDSYKYKTRNYMYSDEPRYSDYPALLPKQTKAPRKPKVHPDLIHFKEMEAKLEHDEITLRMLQEKYTHFSFQTLYGELYNPSPEYKELAITKYNQKYAI